MTTLSRKDSTSQLLESSEEVRTGKHAGPDEKRLIARQAARLVDRVTSESWLTQGGPVFDIGDVLLSRDIWLDMPPALVVDALTLHQCGCWGAVSDVDWDRNQRALQAGGVIVSHWTPETRLAFWVVTDLLRLETRVFYPISA